MKEVVGNLEHNYQFKPKTRADRDLLVKWLMELEYGPFADPPEYHESFA